MKKRVLNSFLLILALLFQVSCSESNMDSLKEDGSNQSQTEDSRVRNYVFAVKTPSKQSKSVGISGKFWEPGDTIRVKFLSTAPGTRMVQQLVKESAKLWEKYAYITFDFVGSNENADVSVAIGLDNSQLSWAVIGTDCKFYDTNTEATVKLLKFSDDELANATTREDFRTIVLRQFGHVLGLGFEHQNPNDGNNLLEDLNFNYENMVAYMLRQGWQNYEIDDLLTAYKKREIDKSSSSFDENSIMLLYFPAYLSSDGAAGKWNKFLSKQDIKYIGIKYPFPKTKLVITYAGEGHAVKHEYEAVRIGEFLWMNSNLYTPTQYGASLNSIKKALELKGMTDSEYLVNLSDFNRYYGAYYDRNMIESRVSNPTVYEVDKQGNQILTTGWNMDGFGAWDQLFAMCGSGTHADVKKYLGAKVGDNPCAFNTSKIAWFTGNENVYGFNLMPGGALFNGPQNDGSGLTTGDFNGLFENERFVGHSRTIVIPTYAHARFTTKLFHWMHIRYSRRLTDQELGYKLYVNSASTDIVKLDLNATAPSGYTELSNGYLRGLYVQYILDNPNPEKTISEIVQLANILKYI